jgi:crotonobetainyl-CoA:carnitine CoA-transferase CaiB-like acyl-CoA transferase
VVAAFERVLTQRPAADWIRALDAAEVPCGVVKTVLEAIQDAGNVSPLTGMPSSVGGKVRFPPPRLDEHGELIRKHGWNAFTETT